MTVRPLTRESLAAGLSRMGLVSGDGVVVHSSFRSLRPFEGGPDDVVDAVLDVIGPGGNLVLPTFNYSSPLPEPCFDSDTMPCRTGVIPETGRRRPGAVRSLHPTHSIAVIGPDADDLCTDHMSFRAFGVGSPLDRLARRGGKVLLLGVGHASNSMIHVAEEHAGIPKTEFAEPRPRARIRMPDGRIVEHEVDSSPSCSTAFEAVAEPLRRYGEISDMRLGICGLQLMTGRAVIDRVGELLRRRPDALLCSNPDCRLCPGVRERIGAGFRARVPTAGHNDT